MAHVYLKENGIILVEILVGLEEWVSPGYIGVFGAENIIQNGNLNSGKKNSKKETRMAVKKYSYGVIHAIIRCLDCDWETGSYKNAQAIAKIHAGTHKHRVEGELGIAIMYDGRE